jgi:copper chaperone CopZ
MDGRRLSKQLVISTALWIVMSMVTGCSSRSAKVPEPVDESHEVRIYEVFGMDCPACHGGVENLVLKIPGVLDAKADWKKRRLTVVLEPGVPVDDERVYDAIRRANFTPGKRIQ